jgi:GNAT superfamily N-acetyltransferase
VNAIVAVGEENAPQIAAFTRVALPYDLLSTTSVRRSIFADTDPQIVLAVFDGGLDAVAVAVARGPIAWVKLIAVHPSVRRTGIATAVLGRLETFCRDAGAKTLAVGNCAPYYVVPGVDARSTDASCFFEARGFGRVGEAVNLGVRLVDLPDPKLPCRIADAADLERLRPWVAEHHPNWINELERGVALDSCVVHRDLGFACIDVNREGWFGPTATHPDARGQGVGTATLLAALHLMRARGHEHAEIAWADALPFYSKAVGARVSRVFWWYGKAL